MDPDWRSTLTHDHRQKIVGKIFNTLQRHMPLSGPDGTNELRKIAVSFEEKIFVAASDQHDYLKTISMKMFNLEIRQQNTQNPAALPTSSSITSQSLETRAQSTPREPWKTEEKTPNSAARPTTNTTDVSWRSTLNHDSRQRIVSKIFDTMQRHMPLSGPDGTKELRKIAVRFEEKVFVAASDQHNYLMKISLKMLNLETRAQNTPRKPWKAGKKPTNSAAQPATNTTDVSWRSTLTRDSRQKIVSKIFDTLQRYMPLSGPDCTKELRRIAVRFEEKIFVAASDEHNYLMKISLKMLNLETQAQNRPNSAAPPTSSS